MSLAAKATWESEPVFRQKANAMVKEGSRKHGQTKRSSTICITTNKNIVHNIDFEKSLSSKDLSSILDSFAKHPDSAPAGFLVSFWLPSESVFFSNLAGQANYLSSQQKVKLIKCKTPELKHNLPSYTFGFSGFDFYLTKLGLRLSWHQNT